MKNLEALKATLSNNKKRIFKTFLGAAGLATIGLGARALLTEVDDEFDYVDIDAESEDLNEEAPEEE